MISWIRERLEGEEGFTLIELLVVVIIIGILAAIAIPTFLRQRERGWEAAAQSMLKNASTAMESYATVNNGSYAVGASNVGATYAAALTSQGLNQVADVAFRAASNAGSYCFQAVHTSGGIAFTLDSSTGTIIRSTNGTAAPACPTTLTPGAVYGTWPGTPAS